MNEIKKYAIQDNIKNWNQNVDNVTWKIQESNKSSIIFLDLKNNEKLQYFLKDLKTTEYSYIITNLDTFPITEFENIIIIKNQDWNSSQKLIMDKYYPISDHKKFVGITGTNGKTTTVDLCLQISAQLNKQAISIGTLGVRKNNKTLIDFSLTTPNYIDFRKFLYLFRNDFDYCFMELSSHSLEQNRLHSTYLECAGWTNITQDHLDYHKTMENYFNSKCKIFNLTNNGPVYISDKVLHEKLHHYKNAIYVQREINSELPLFFKSSYNLSNLKLALEICQFLGFPVENIDYTKLNPPPGRFNIQKYKDNYIVIDFAHTPDAIENICKSLRENFPQLSLSIVFGCGGDRDRTKRPLMGKAAEKYCDKIYLTSDNPRSEDPSQIIQDIVAGIKDQKKITMDPDRKLIIKQAIENLKNEVLLIAGKGHENYIQIHNIKHPYSDQEEVNKNIGVK